MSSAAQLAAALALLCAAAALWFARRGVQRSERSSTERFIDSHIAGAAARGAATDAAAVRRAGGTGPHAPRSATAHATGRARRRGRWKTLMTTAAGALHGTLSRAGLADLRAPLFAAVLCGMLLSMLAAAFGGPFAAGATLVVCGVALYVLLAWRTRTRRRRIVRQLPSFLDGIVRLVVLGNSVPAAFQSAVQVAEAPLRECLDHVSRMLRTGVEIDHALQHASELYRVSEFEMVGSVLRLSVKYGGRADTMLDRMATFMRDLEQAERELSAMSAETRLSSWVLALLPIGIGGFLILSNPRYFASMWHDSTGRELVYAAFGLQSVGVLLLYRLARLRK